MFLGVGVGLYALRVNTRYLEQSVSQLTHTQLLPPPPRSDPVLSAFVLLLLFWAFWALMG
eukprot:3795659-Amphidinium_carterae.1